MTARSPGPPVGVRHAGDPALAGLRVRELIARLAATEEATRAILTDGVGAEATRDLLGYQEALLAELRRRRQGACAAARVQCPDHHPQA